VVIPPDYQLRTFKRPAGGRLIARRVYRRPGTGPTVILIHEAPGLSETTFAIAKRLSDEGYSVVLPELLRPGRSGPPGVRLFVGMLRLCIARELAALSGGKTGAIVEWLRELAKEESADNGGRPVAVIGMCFSGGFALGTILDDSVGAAVMSQPALPFPIWFGRSSDLGVSKADLAAIKTRIGDGDRLRVLRYSRDIKSPAARFCRVVREFPAAEHREVPATSWKDHSVLAHGATAVPDTDLEKAFTGTLAFLEAHLSAT
jgi:pimeloyl-ACP methyl ester carboxylesterase